MPRIRMIAAGSALPETIVDNHHFARSLDTSDDWIRQRTGIVTRRWAAQNESLSDFAVLAARDALAQAALQPGDIDLIILATTTPDRRFPATAVDVQQRLGCSGAAFDLQAVCAGFIYALATARALLLAGQARRALVIGADLMSRLLDPTDRGTAILFGDGAGAVVLTRDDTAGAEGILAVDLHSDGHYRDLLMVPDQTMIMNGREVFRHAVTLMGDSICRTLDLAGVAADALDWLVPHQANVRIINAIGARIDLPPEKVVITVDHHGNTSAASIPLALTEALNQGRIRPGDMIMLTALGGGFAWGSALLRWG